MPVVAFMILNFLIRWKSIYTMIELTSELAMIISFVVFQFVLTGETRAVAAPRVRTLVFPLLRMPGCNMALKIGLSLKGSLMVTTRHSTTERCDVDVVDMRLEPLACLEENLAVASGPGT